MFLTDSQCMQAVADLLKYDISALPGYWTSVVSQAHVAAYQEIQGRLLARGFTTAQVVLWDRGAEFERMLTIYWSLVNGGGTTAYDDRFIKQFDRRSDLDSVLVSVAGTWIIPGETPGTVGTGFEDTTGDLFSLDRDDPLRGEASRP